MKSTIALLAATLATAAVVFGGGNGQGSGQNGPQSGSGNGSVAAAAFSISGPVKEVFLGTGVQNPSILVQNSADQVEYLVRLGPLYYLQEEYGFEVAAGNVVNATIMQCCNTTADYYVAITIQNVTLDGPGIELRDADTGLPLWTQAARAQRGGNGEHGARAGARSGGACLLGATVTTVNGTVQEFSAAAGLRLPVLLLKTEAGNLLSIQVGPARILLENGFELQTGDAVIVTYAVSSCTSENVAYTLTNTAGVTVTLRNSDGTIAW